MKLATDKAHRDYFYKHGVIEFDALFTPDQVREMNVTIDNILCKNLGIRRDQLVRQSPQEIFLHGRDLYREDEALKKHVLHRRLAEIAVELTEARSLRIGYEQLFVGETKEPLIENVYNQFLHQEGTLQNKSCITPVVCGLMLCLEPATFPEIPPALFPKTAGSGVFFKPDLPFDLTFLSHAQGGRYLLIVYAHPRTVYILNDNDPHTHALKHKGYVFGDKLSDKLNPLIYR